MFSVGDASATVDSPSTREQAPYDAALEFAVGAALFGVIAGGGSLFGSNVGLVGVYVGGVRVARGIGLVVETFSRAPTNRE